MFFTAADLHYGFSSYDDVLYVDAGTVLHTWNTFFVLRQSKIFYCHAMSTRDLKFSAM